MTVYYNESDPYAAQWLRNLMAAGILPAGTVDERSIAEVGPGDLGGHAECHFFAGLGGHAECHFFAGIGGWPLALALAGWTGPVWTGSCPCQPFSSAGQRKGSADPRHLWPEFYRLIRQRRPPVVFGEQVASRLGREWLAGVRLDLEVLGYAVGAADLPAAGVGAPHIRQRLFWAADAAGRAGTAGLPAAEWQEPPNGRATGGLGDAETSRCEVGSRLAEMDGSSARQGSEQADLRLDVWRDAVWLPCLDGKARRVEPGIFPLADGVPSRVGRLRAYGNAVVPQAAAEFVRSFIERKGR